MWCGGIDCGYLGIFSLLLSLHQLGKILIQIWIICHGCLKHKLVDNLAIGNEFEDRFVWKPATSLPLKCLLLLGQEIVIT